MMLDERGHTLRQWRLSSERLVLLQSVGLLFVCLVVLLGVASWRHRPQAIQMATLQEQHTDLLQQRDSFRDHLPALQAAEQRALQRFYLL